MFIQAHSLAESPLAKADVLNSAHWDCSCPHWQVWPQAATVMLALTGTSAQQLTCVALHSHAAHLTCMHAAVIETARRSPSKYFQETLSLISVRGPCRTASKDSPYSSSCYDYHDAWSTRCLIRSATPYCAAVHDR
jgi:hypothetical protein